MSERITDDGCRTADACIAPSDTRHPSPVMRRPSSVLALLFALTGCAYYNGLYNAKAETRAGDRLSRQGREAEATSRYATAAATAETVLVRYPKSRWRPQALALAGRTLALAGDCALARPRLREALALPVLDAEVREHLLVAQLRTADADASTGALKVLKRLVQRIRARWPQVRIIFRGDGGFTRDPIMTWCEAHQVYYVLGLAKNARLLKRIRMQQYEAQRLYEHTGHSGDFLEVAGQAARVFTEFRYRTRDSWNRTRRVIAKAEHLSKGANPRFVVTNLSGRDVHSRELYEDLYCARGDMENRIKEQQLDLFADRTSAHTLRANQLRLWFSSLAYVLMSTLRRIGLRGTRLAQATCGTIRLKLFKIGALIKLSVRRFMIHLATACPYQDVFRQALNNILAYPLRI